MSEQFEHLVKQNFAQMSLGWESARELGELHSNLGKFYRDVDNVKIAPDAVIQAGAF